MIALVLIGFAIFRSGADDRALDQLAQETCEDLDGEMRLVGAIIIGRAVDRANALGFEGHELGRAMDAYCPSIMRQIRDF